MTEATTDGLLQMARHVATQLVVDALKHLVANVPALPVTVTVHPQPSRRDLDALVHPQPVRRLLAPKPGKRRGRKPGPKPKTAKRAPWTPEQHAKFSRTMAAKRGAPVVVKPRIGRPRKVAPAPTEVRCTNPKCDHTLGEHDSNTGECLSMRCQCTRFWK